MKKYVLGTMLCLSLMACDQQDKPRQVPPVGQNYDSTGVNARDRDNTGINVRDRDALTKTPLDQSESDADRTVTQKLRQLVMADNGLSTNAKNIKIITINGVVTLRGPVDNMNEKDAIEKKLRNVPGVVALENQLEIVHNH